MSRCLHIALAALVLGAIGVWRAAAATTNLVVFSETMGTNTLKPWTGTGCNYPWSLAYSVSNPFEQNTNANYGSGNTNGMSFKMGTTNLADSSITTAAGINARGNSGTLSFYLNAAGLTNNNGWAMLLNNGAGFTTRLAETNGTNHTWRNYTYVLQPADLVSNLFLQFQFASGQANARIWLDQITLTVTFGTSNVIIPFSAQYVRIPGGNFLMGDQFGYIDLKHYTDEEPVHNVYISPLYMATTLATCREYCDYLNSALTNGSIEVRTNIVYAVGGTNVFFYTHDASSSSRIQFQNNSFTVLNSRDLHPVTSVRWFGAIAYCNWLSQQGGFDSCYNVTNGDVDFSKNGFRLPTEAEWEYAAHGGQTNPYVMFPWGMNTNANGTFANWENSYDPFESTNDYPCTTPVGFYNGALRLKSDYNWPGSQLTYQTSDGSNPYGLYDMGGNVWEWCNDWYMNTYYAYCTNNNIVTNPPGPTYAQADLFPSNSAPGAVAYRCLRGGTWWNGNSASDYDYGHARVSNRDPSYFLGGGPPGDPNGQWSQTGFRVMRPEKITQTIGLFLNTTNASPGYTLMSPMQGNNTYLLNNSGQYVHRWTSSYNPGRAEYLTPEGHLLRTCSVGNQSKLNTGGGEGGRLEERDWQNNLIWCFELNTTNQMTHHDLAQLPNGNVLMIACEKIYLANLLAAGFKTNAQTEISVRTNGGFALPDYIIEVRPDRKDGTTNGTIVWEWHVMDHLIQDYDATKANYGVVSNHVELINANAGNLQQFWNHFNGIDYNPQFDQILISSRNQSEVWVIDHSTTTIQAAGHTGGKYGKGGDLLYRWGNPAICNLTDATHKEMLWQQHCAVWIPTNCPGAGHILIHDNGIGRVSPASAWYTSIDEIVPPVNANGFYAGASNVYFGPTNYFWVYTNSPATNFYGADIGGVERELNGNTLITFGIRGTLFEVTTNRQTVWQYVNPSAATPYAQGSTVPFDPNSNINFPLQTMNEVFKVHRYPASFSGFAGKDLTPRGTIETYTGAATDTVGLGLPDIWTRSHFGNLSAVTATSDHDGDGLSDLLEYQLGIDPTAWSSANNGIPDGWAIAYGFDPTLAAVAKLINTNGNTTLQNYLADLNPTNAASRLAITKLQVTGGNVNLTWIGGNNAWQYLECSPSLTTNQWTTISTNNPPTSITNNFIHTGANGGSNLFYRIKATR